ncbi:helix-turn-helix domain-containing protein [Terribacillus saccharophilus]|uniref:Cro/C1-type HTH DNA-binding domain-containing protein n=1 Tax=Terribacillus saccharophilus TaxID=361277 RepID=A0ABX4H0A3_9BACI|nr:helix-turn-helix domain-containing protein [Terribacillus saccharophilus]PAD35960.1 hypothetical protein CHH56_05915 [Terribacillus saccharophilus]PAD96990.1 hypothetical protein CHH50_06395 [Terribacillus saccharophilus]PAE00566.1 hypothetical protein CHH48_07300 [Terribacillus saccharophilus]
MAVVVEIRLKELLKERGITQEELWNMSKEDSNDPKTATLAKSSISEMCNNVRQSINKKHIAAVVELLDIEDINELIIIRKE